jgi:hypothetical protein
LFAKKVKRKMKVPFLSAARGDSSGAGERKKRAAGGTLAADFDARSGAAEWLREQQKT